MGNRALRPRSSPPACVHSSEGACRAMRRLCSPSCLPPLHVCLTDSKQPGDSLSEHAWWYTAVTKSHSKLLASGRRPGICLEDTENLETSLKALFRSQPWYIQSFVRPDGESGSPSGGSRHGRSNPGSIATSVRSAACRVKRFWATCFSGNTAGCSKF